MVAEIVSAYVSNNSVPPVELPGLIASVHGALGRMNQPAGPAAEPIEKPTPSEIKKSITPDALISFVDGKPYKTLRRHLTRHGLSFEEYKARYSLPRDYPSTAASYSAQRAELAKSLGLGRQRQKGEEAGTTAPKATRGRRKAQEATVAE
ncbi:MucR family transcriptional regulator [Methylobacterium oxalidis]|nr:MucR family transcriptional regulator [Methylobacterium oxalidis]